MNTPHPWDDELADLLDDWELAEPLTRQGCFDDLLEPYSGSYTEPDSGEEGECAIEQLEWSERFTRYADVSEHAVQASRKLRRRWPDAIVKPIEWEGGLRYCGIIRRRCLRIERPAPDGAYVRYIRPAGECDDRVDRT